MDLLSVVRVVSVECGESVESGGCGECGVF